MNQRNAAYLVGLDQGTTSTRALLITDKGEVVKNVSQPVACKFPQPGWVEQDADAIFESARTCLNEAMAGLNAAQVAGIGITNQRETLVLWERDTLRALGPAIVWQCRRSESICDLWRKQGWADDVRKRTGLPLDPYFSASKLAWRLDQAPELRRRAEAGEIAFGTVDAWLIACFTQGRLHLTDASNASRTLLYDLDVGGWSRELCEAFKIPMQILPEVRDSFGDFGSVQAADGNGVISIRAVLGDQQAALFGQAALQSGQAKYTLGTGGFLVVNTGENRRSSKALAESGLLETVAWQHQGQKTFAIEGSVFSAGAAVQWLRDELGFFSNSSEIEDLAASVPDSGGVVLVPAFTGLGAPHWDAAARGSLFGLTRGTSRAHLARATLEALALQCREVIQAANDLTGEPLRFLSIDGGATKNHLLIQILADIVQIPVIRPDFSEVTALGAALAAGVGAGLYATLGEAGSVLRLASRHVPDTSFDPSPTVARFAKAVAACRRFSAT